MKTLHAAVIAKLVSKGKIGSAVDLLTLVGPDTDIVLLLQEIQTLKQQAKNGRHKLYDSREELDKMSSALFRAATLHYPEQAEAYLRSVKDEHVLASILGDEGERSMNSIASTIGEAMRKFQDKKPERDEEEDITSIIAEERDKVLGKVVSDTYVPAFREFFKGKDNILIMGSNSELEPFSSIIEKEHILGAHIDEADRNAFYVESLSHPVDAPSSESRCIMMSTKHKRVDTGTKTEAGKTIYKMVDKPGAPVYSANPLKGFFREIEKIDHIILTPDNYDEDEDEVQKEKVVYPKFTLNITFHPERLMPIGLIKKDKTDEEGMIYGARSVRVGITVAYRNGYYVPIIPTLAKQKKDEAGSNDAVMVINVVKTFRRNAHPKFTGWSIYDRDFRKTYRGQITTLVRRLIKECNGELKARAPKLIGMGTSSPLLKEVIEFYAAKQKQTSVAGVEAPAASSEVPDETVQKV